MQAPAQTTPQSIAAAASPGTKACSSLLAIAVQFDAVREVQTRRKNTVPLWVLRVADEGSGVAGVEVACWGEAAKWAARCELGDFVHISNLSWEHDARYGTKASTSYRSVLTVVLSPASGKGAGAAFSRQLAPGRLDRLKAFGSERLAAWMKPRAVPVLVAVPAPAPVAGALSSLSGLSAGKASVVVRFDSAKLRQLCKHADSHEQHLSKPTAKRRRRGGYCVRTVVVDANQARATLLIADAELLRSLRAAAAAAPAAAYRISHVLVEFDAADLMVLKATTRTSIERSVALGPAAAPAGSGPRRMALTELLASAEYVPAARVGAVVRAFRFGAGGTGADAVVACTAGAHCCAYAPCCLEIACPVDGAVATVLATAPAMQALFCNLPASRLCPAGSTGVRERSAATITRIVAAYLAPLIPGMAGDPQCVQLLLQFRPTSREVVMLGAQPV